MCDVFVSAIKRKHNQWVRFVQEMTRLLDTHPCMKALTCHHLHTVKTHRIGNLLRFLRSKNMLAAYVPLPTLPRNLLTVPGKKQSLT